MRSIHVKKHLTAAIMVVLSVLIAYILGDFLVSAVCLKNGGCLEEGWTLAHLTVTAVIWLFIVTVIVRH